MAGEDDARGGAEGGVRWETYPSGADILGMKVESFRRLAFRKGWRRTPGNDGLVRVAIPLAEVEQRLAGQTHDNAEAAGDGVTYGARGGATLAGAQEDLVAELRRRAEAAESRAERAEDERDNLATEVIKERERRAGTEGELAAERQARIVAEAREAEAVALTRQVVGQLDAAHRERAEAVKGEGIAMAGFEQLLGRVKKAEGERDAARGATARAETQAATECGARQAVEAVWETAEAEAAAARAELADWTTGGPLARAWRTFLSRRGRP